jgi:hypothetical protein
MKEWRMAPLDAGECSASLHGLFIPEERPKGPLALVGWPKVGVKAVGKSKVWLWWLLDLRVQLL